ncbi:MAG: hypothetical protein CL878_13835 [Dehalococcoidia bacterium]|nr:hypothetical protein [Dehalococcoidia bacterium]
MSTYHILSYGTRCTRTISSNDSRLAALVGRLAVLISLVTAICLVSVPGVLAQVPVADEELFRTFARGVDAALATGETVPLLARTDSSVAWHLGPGRLAVPTSEELEALLAALVPAGSRITHLQSDIPPGADRAYFLTEPGPLFWIAERRLRRPEISIRTWRVVLVEEFKEFPIFFDLRSIAEVDFRDPSLAPTTAQREHMAFIDRQGFVHVVTLPEGRDATYFHPRLEVAPERIVGWDAGGSLVLESAIGGELQLWTLHPPTQTWTPLGSGRRASVSPDGRWLLYEVPPRFSGLFGDTGPVALRDLTQLERPARLVPSLPFPDPVGWRADGSEVLVGPFVMTTANGRTRPSPFESLVVRSPDQAPVPCAYVPSWSPDHSQLAGLVPAPELPGQVQVVVVPAAGGAVQRLAPVPTDPTMRSCPGRPPLPWLADSSAVYLDAGGAVGQVLVTLDGGPPVGLGVEGVANPGQTPRLGRRRRPAGRTSETGTRPVRDSKLRTYRSLGGHCGVASRARPPALVVSSRGEHGPASLALDRANASSVQLVARA